MAQAQTQTRTQWRAFVGLGASQGDRAQSLAAVVDHFAQGRNAGCEFVACSRVYETRPIGAAVQPFLNAAIELRCDIEPAALLEMLLSIEQAHGRTRTVHWADRTLDLDLLAGLECESPARGVERDSPSLRVPHPRAHERDFVLAPLCELAPDLRLCGRPVYAHLRALGPAARTILAVHDRLVPRR